MSRIGKVPVPIPAGVEVTIAGSTVSVKGPKGSLSRTMHARISMRVEEGVVKVERKSDEKLDRSLHGLTRVLIVNMIEGVTKGFERRLELQGVGYRAQVQGKKMTLSLGFSHPVEFMSPEGIAFSFDEEKKNIIIIRGIDKELVGQTAANLRALRPPEPYKGKGIRYAGEYVRRKAGKVATAAAK